MKILLHVVFTKVLTIHEGEKSTKKASQTLATNYIVTLSG